MKYSLISNIKYVYKKAFQYNKKLIFFIPLLIFCSLLLPIISTLIPTAAIFLITKKESILIFIIIMGGISLIYIIFGFIKTYLESRINFENTFVRLSKFALKQTKKLMTTDYINVEPNDKQLLIQKSIQSFDSNWFGMEFMMKNFPGFIINIIGLIVYSILISSINFWIILILIAMTILNIILSIYARNFEQKNKNEFIKYDNKIEYLYNNSNNLVNGKDVRIYKIEKWFNQAFSSLIKKRVFWFNKVENRYFLPKFSDSLFLFIRDIIAYSIIVTMVINKTIDVTVFTFFIGIISGFSTWLNEFITSYTGLKRANLGVNDFREYEDVDEVFNHGSGVDINTLDYPLSIEFKNVCFKYPDAKENTLSNINFKIEPGMKLAIVGVNGAGKTTLVKILSGLYYPTSGEILVGGIPIQKFNINDYYKLIGAVFQDIEALAYTIAKNVACVKEDEIDYQRVDNCLKLAGLKEKVESLKDKEKTYITQSLNKDGILLSGGETQKLMLARALYKDAPIIVLDEPTAALDPLAEAELYEKYSDLTSQKTSIFISHRLSSTKFCDRIIFIDNGTIIEEGSHSDLMKKEGKYKEMFDIQSHYYKENLEVNTNEK